MKLKIVLLCAVAALVLAFTGCSSDETKTADATDTGTTSTVESTESAGKITIPFNFTVEVIGEGDDPFSFTNEDADSIGPVEIKAAVKDGDNMGEASTYYGITIEDLLKFAGVTDYKLISVESTSGMSVELDGSRLVPGGAGFCWLKDGEELDSETGPIQFVNDGRGPKHWVSQVGNVVIVKE